jgi:ribosomal protein S18 acetylase RimI-like enzyme
MDDSQPAITLSRPLIRAAQPDDVEVLHRFILELAEAEQFPAPVTAQPDDLAEVLFGPRPVAEAVLATVDGQPAGFALFYPIYSTVLGRTGIHLEDLYIRPEQRGSGLGRALIAHLARLAIERGGARLEWGVLRTNEDAIRLYRRLQARPLEEIEIFRLEGDVLHDLAGTPE